MPTASKLASQRVLNSAPSAKLFATRPGRLLLALGVSALLHFWLLHGSDFAFVQPRIPPAVIEAQLTPRPPPLRPLPAVAANVPPKQLQRARRALPPPVQEAPELAAAPASDAVVAPAPPPAAPVATEPIAAASEAAAPEPMPSVKGPTMPRRIDIEFAVLRSGGGSGIARHVWQRSGEHSYSISSTLEATGIAALFMHGKYVQTSQGSIGENGLQPRIFTVERRNKTQSARFDYDANSIIFSDGQAPAELLPEAQDLLSFVFQFAYNPPQRKSLDLLLTNGRKLGRYNYLVLDDETLATPVGAIATMHIHKLHEPDDNGIEMWLAPDLFYAPVKMLWLEKDGTRYELNITSLRIES